MWAALVSLIRHVLKGTHEFDGKLFEKTFIDDQKTITKNFN